MIGAVGKKFGIFAFPKEKKGCGREGGNGLGRGRTKALAYSSTLHY